MSSATFSTSIEAQQAAALLANYRFELGNHDARQWVSLWLESYRPAWIRDAVIEALYQGRYKSVSVRQILELWQRRGQPIRHVTHDFEAAVCREFAEAKLIANTALPGVQTGVQTNGRASTTQTRNRGRNNGHTQRKSISHRHSSTSSASNLGSNGRTEAVSFNLSAVSPGMAAPEPDVADDSSQSPSASNLEPSNDSYRRVSRAAIQSPAETEALLRTQRQRGGVLYRSARAIPPFKPALPFSAQTLRLAKQKASV